MEINYDSKTSYKYVRIFVIFANPRAGKSISFKQGLNELGIQLKNKKESNGYNPCFRNLIDKGIIGFNEFGYTAFYHRNFETYPLKGLCLNYHELLYDIVKYVSKLANEIIPIPKTQLKTKLVEYLKEYLRLNKNLDLKANKFSLKDFYLGFLYFVKKKASQDSTFNLLLKEFNTYLKSKNSALLLAEEVMEYS